MKKILSLVLTLMLAVCLIGAAVAEYDGPQWDRNADVVVVGFGPAGAMAAKTAVENGATTLVLEKANKEFAGGSAPTSMGFIFSPYTSEMLHNYSYGRLTVENAQRMADKANAAVEWLTSTGLEMQGQVAVGYGVGFYQQIVKNIEAMGIEVLYETPAQKLIFDPVTKEVFGVQCTDAQGNVINVRANKGVILATGGYLGNEDLMTRFHFSNMPEIVSLGAPTQTGDGLMMALEVGAGLDGLTNQQIEWYGMAFKKASDEIGTGILHMTDGMSPNARIFVNGNGERFMNEETYLVHNKEQLNLFDYEGIFPAYGDYTNYPMYTIFDSTLFDSGCVGAPDGYSTGYASAYDIYNWTADNKAELERGWLVKADTIEELVEKLAEQSGNEKIDAETLKKTIEEYNAACDAGVDAKFGRESFYLSKISTGPYYAAEIVPAAVYTIGGLQGGENFETLDWHGNPIPRLYHAGDIGQPTKLMMACLQGAMAMGEIAAEACVNLESH